MRSAAFLILGIVGVEGAGIMFHAHQYDAMVAGIAVGVFGFLASWRELYR